MSEKPNFDQLAIIRAEGEGMTGFTQPLPTSTTERRFCQIEQERATDEGMPLPPGAEIVMRPEVAVRI